MSSNNITLVTTNARIDALEGKIDTILDRLTAKSGKAKAKKATTTRKSTTGKPRKTAERKPASGTIEGKTCLVSGNRKQFIADHEWAQNGMSVRQLAEAVLTGGQSLVGNWAIGPKRTQLVTGVAPKASKGKAKAVVAKVSASDAAKPCRRANGTIAPKSEWIVRRALEAQGLDRVKVDKRTAKAMKVLA